MSAVEVAHLYRILVIGSKGSGKTALVHRSQSGAFDGKEPTYGLSGSTKIACIDHMRTTHGKVLFDTVECGDAKSVGVVQDVHGVICLIDVTSKSSMHEALELIKAVRTAHPLAPIVLCANKVDSKQRCITPKMFGMFTGKLQVYPLEYSSRSCYNWEKPWLYFIQVLLDLKARFVSDR
jgi:GTPase SAR1 family protein